MNPVRMPGCDLTIGEAQGYRGLPIRFDVEPSQPRFATGHNVITTYWQPTPEEQADIAAGKPVVIHLYTQQHPPLLVQTRDSYQQ